MRRFSFRLALALGKTVRQLLDEIDAAELAEWEAYFQLEPFGEERADLRAGIIAATVANAAGSKTKFKPADFMPDFGDSRRPQTPQELADKIKAAFGILK